MTWIFPVYIVALAYLTVQKDLGDSKASLAGAWSWLAGLAISQFVFALFRAGNARNTRDMILVEIWANGFAWLFLGFSMFCLGAALRKGQDTLPSD
ncbi:hypothetical protein [Haloferula sp.]|uniref:hypothetical protein n=1 Tax=Haloferula sp. TaxID=2497595 RepID=UPI00329D5C8E